MDTPVRGENESEDTMVEAVNRHIKELAFPSRGEERAFAKRTPG